MGGWTRTRFSVVREAMSAHGISLHRGGPSSAYRLEGPGFAGVRAYDLDEAIALVEWECIELDIPGSRTADVAD